MSDAKATGYIPERLPALHPLRKLAWRINDFLDHAESRYLSEYLDAAYDGAVADAAELARLTRALSELRAAFRANMLRHCANATHEEITRAMDAVAGPDPEIARLSAELATAKADRNTYDSAHKTEAANVLRLTAELEALRVDAARYRWLRDNDARVVECMVQRRGYRSTAIDAKYETWDEHEGWIVSTQSIHVPAFATMDAAIDAAMTREPT